MKIQQRFSIKKTLFKEQINCVYALVLRKPRVKEGWFNNSYKNSIFFCSIFAGPTCFCYASSTAEQPMHIHDRSSVASTSLLWYTQQCYVDSLNYTPKRVLYRYGAQFRAPAMLLLRIEG
jgi:hypothetical protein